VADGLQLIGHDRRTAQRANSIDVVDAHDDVAAQVERQRQPAAFATWGRGVLIRYWVAA
jgi:hypothetical protein